MRALVLCILVMHAAYAEGPAPAEQPSHGSSIEHDLSLFFRLTSRGLTAPLHWEQDDWRNAAGTVFFTGLSGLLDEEAYTTALRNRSATNDKLERVFEAYSNGLTGIMFSGVFYTSGLLFDSEWLRGTGLVIASALTISAITQTTFKYIAGRARPYTGFSNSKFRPFSFNSDFVAFPSGHTIVAFTVSTVLSKRIDNIYASIALYSAAALGGFSRIYSGNHWLSDVVFGGVLAVYVSSWAVRQYEGEQHSDDNSGLKIFPHANGLRIVWKF